MTCEAFEPGSVVIATGLTCLQGLAGLPPSPSPSPPPPPATTILLAQSPSLLLVVLPCWSAMFLLFFWNVLVGCEPQVIEHLTGGQEWVCHIDTPIGKEVGCSLDLGLERQTGRRPAPGLRMVSLVGRPASGEAKPTPWGTLV